jgi:outer membrane protein
VILWGCRRNLLAGAALASLMAMPAKADDLRGALVQAYNGNPTLLAAREQLRAMDEGVPLARADALPAISASVSETEFVKQSELSSYDMPRSLSVAGSLSIPLYSGGAVRNALKAANTRIIAGRGDLLSAEANVFSQTVAAYMDVIRTDAIVALNRNQVKALEVNLKATTDRFAIGDVTRTDVAQSQSRLALAVGTLRNAEANLVQARETYIQIIGKEPEALASPPTLPNLPETAEDAVGVALKTNPDLAAAHERSKAAGFDTSAARASRLPKVSLFADAGYTDYLNSLTYPTIPGYALPERLKTGDVGIRATLPLYQGGRPSAQIKQAQAREGQALDTEIASERQVIANTRAAFSSWRAAKEVIAATKVAVDAAELSLKGVRAENGVGNRTVLDILNAEQELINAQVQLVTAERNAYVAGFTLLVAMGKGGAKDLGLDGGALYDPLVHARSARAELTDWGGDKVQGAGTPTRTVDTKAQTGSSSAN